MPWPSFTISTSIWPPVDLLALRFLVRLRQRYDRRGPALPCAMMTNVLTVAHKTNTAAMALWLFDFADERASHTPPNEIDRHKQACDDGVCRTSRNALTK